METNSLFPLKYRLRKTDEPVEIIAWDTLEKGARSHSDWVSYIDADGNEHIKEHLTLEWDFKVESPFGGGFGSSLLENTLNSLDPWEARRYELVKEMFFDSEHNDVAFLGYDGLVKRADAIIAALKKSPEATEFVEDDGYENIGIGEIVDAIDGPEHLKKFLFTDKKDIVGFRGDNGRWAVGDRVKVYIKRLDPQEEERPVP